MVSKVALKERVTTMKTAKKVWIIIAVCLIVLGAIIGAVSLAMMNFDFSNLNTNKFVSNEHKITEDFNNIKIDVDTSDIEFVRSQTEECMVVTIDTDKIKHSVSVQNGTLTVSVEDDREWYDYIGIWTGEISLTIHLPKDSYDSLDIDADTSDITVAKDFTFENVEIETDTGDVEFLASASEKLDINTDTGEIKIGELGNDYKNINLKTDTGDIKLWYIVADEKITVQSSTGDVWLSVINVPYVSVKTSTGDVEGNLYTAPKFITKTGTGDVNVPEAKTDDVFEITTGTGDIYFKIVK